MKPNKILAGILSALLMLSVPNVAAFAEYFPEQVEAPKLSGIEVNQPDVILRTDYKKGYTTLLLCIPEEKYELFRKEYVKGRTYLELMVWFGDISEKRDNDPESRMAKYNVSYYFCDPDNLSGEYVEAFDDNDGIPEDDYQSEAFVANDGTHYFAVSLKNESPIAKAAREAEEFRIEYYIHSMKKDIDGGAYRYITKTETDKPMLEFPVLDCSKPNVVLLDDWQEGCSTLFFVIPKEKYEFMHNNETFNFTYDHVSCNMTAKFKNGRSAQLTLRSWRGVELTAYSADGVPGKGNFSVQGGFNKNGDYIAALTCNSNEDFMSWVKADYPVTMSYSITSDKGLHDGNTEFEKIHNFYPPALELSELDFTQPSVQIRTDCLKDYTSAIFTIPAEKVDLFKKVKSENKRARMYMQADFPFGCRAWFDIADMDSFDLEGFEDDCTADGGFRTWVGYTDNGGLIGVLSCSNNADFAKILRTSRECSLTYYIASDANNGTLADGSKTAAALRLGSEREIIPGYESKKPDVFVSTEYKKGYTALIFSVPKEKYELFCDTNQNDGALLNMQAWFGDFSEERDNDDELPMAAYHAEFSLTDPNGGENGYYVETFVEDCGEDFLPIIEEFTTKDGGYAAAVCFEDSESIAKAAREADELRIFYSIQSKGKYIDGSWENYTVKSLKSDISELVFGKISARSYTGNALKPAVVIKDGNKKLVKGTDYSVTYKNNRNIGTAEITVMGKGDYTGTKKLSFKIVPKKTTLSSKPGKTSGGWKRVTLGWKKSPGASGYQIYYSENGGKFKRLTTVSSEKLSCTIRYTIGNTEQFKVRPYTKVNGKTYYGSWSNVITVN